jgi:hypothetical protein
VPPPGDLGIDINKIRARCQLSGDSIYPVPGKLASTRWLNRRPNPRNLGLAAPVQAKAARHSRGIRSLSMGTPLRCAS